MPKVYIAGPMTGIEAFNFPAFDKARDQWRKAGWQVVSPADLTREYWKQNFGEEFDPHNPDPRIAAGGDIYREFLRGDVAAIAYCDTIALLPGWEKSSGCAKELTVAKVLNLNVADALTFASLDVTTPQAESALQEAQRLVHGNRGADYGHPIDDYTRTGRLWSAILDGWLRHIGFDVEVRNTDDMPRFPDIDPRVACLMMAAVKISREVNKHKRDNLVDLAGYAECAHMVAERQGERTC